MNEPSDENLRQLLKSAAKPVGERELRRDLWPEMLRKLDEGAAPVPWFDWVLVALVAAGLVFFPQVIPLLLYQL